MAENIDVLLPALEIAGWPEWVDCGCRYRLASRAHCYAEGAQQTYPWRRDLILGYGEWNTDGNLTAHEAAVLIREHLREWLHAHGIAVVWSNSVQAYVIKDWRGGRSEWVWVLQSNGDYDAALAAAVQAVGGGK
jgi:hypothetical protein